LKLPQPEKKVFYNAVGFLPKRKALGVKEKNEKKKE